MTGGWKTSNSALKDMIQETEKTWLRATPSGDETMRPNNGSVPLKTVDAFQIQFQHIKAHKDLDLGNNWIDSCVKEGTEGFSSDRPNAPPDKSIEQRLQSIEQRSAQRGSFRKSVLLLQSNRMYKLKWGLLAQIFLKQDYDSNMENMS